MINIINYPYRFQEVYLNYVFKISENLLEKPPGISEKFFPPLFAAISGDIIENGRHKSDLITISVANKSAQYKANL